MSSNVPGNEWRARTLRAWQLSILRFAVTQDNADRLAVMAIASELDRLAPQHGGKPDFDFFRRSSMELCAAILQPSERAAEVLRQYLARIDDDRLKRALAAAIEADQPKVSSAGKSSVGKSSVDKSFKRDNELWRGLPSRSNQI